MLRPMPLSWQCSCLPVSGQIDGLLRWVKFARSAQGGHNVERLSFDAETGLIPSTDSNKLL